MTQSTNSFLSPEEQKHSTFVAAWGTRIRGVIVRGSGVNHALKLLIAAEHNAHIAAAHHKSKGRCLWEEPRNQREHVQRDNAVTCVGITQRRAIVHETAVCAAERVTRLGVFLSEDFDFFVSDCHEVEKCPDPDDVELLASPCVDPNCGHGLGVHAQKHFG